MLMFQSLIGIIWNCNYTFTSGYQAMIMFQSLIGIIWNCNVEEYREFVKSHSVSIPNRDYLELQ